MFCTKCGTENADSSVFCKNCGASLSTNHDFPAGGNAYSAQVSHTFAGAVIKTLSSSKMLALCIVYTISACWSVFSSLLGFTVSDDIIAQIFSEHGTYFPEDSVTSSVSITGLFTLVPAGLMIAGLWMILSAAKNAKISGEMKIGGFMMMKVVLIIKMVGTIILSALIALALGMTAAIGDIATLPATYSDQIDGFDGFGSDFGGFDFAPYSGFGEVMLVLAIVLCVIILIILAMYTVLCALAVKETGNIAKTVRDNEFSRNISMGLIVFTFICAGLNLIGGSFLNGAAYVLAAVVLLDMRSNITSVLYSPQAE